MDHRKLNQRSAGGEPLQQQTQARQTVGESREKTLQGHPP
jgi:hypothetical protein